MIVKWFVFLGQIWAICDLMSFFSAIILAKFLGFFNVFFKVGFWPFFAHFGNLYKKKVAQNCILPTGTCCWINFLLLGWLFYTRFSEFSKNRVFIDFEKFVCVFLWRCAKLTKIFYFCKNIVEIHQSWSKLEPNMLRNQFFENRKKWILTLRWVPNLGVCHKHGKAKKIYISDFLFF